MCTVVIDPLTIPWGCGQNLSQSQALEAKRLIWIQREKCLASIMNPVRTFNSLAAMSNQQLLQFISRSAQRRDERPATSGTQVPRKRIGTYTCINKAYQKGPVIHEESNVTQVTQRSRILQIVRKQCEDLERAIV